LAEHFVTKSLPLPELEQIKLCAQVIGQLRSFVVFLTTNRLESLDGFARVTAEE
jgi:hypothetical protein